MPIEKSTAQNTILNTSVRLWLSLTTTIIAKTIEVAPRRPAKETTAICRAFALNGASAAVTARGRITKFIARTISRAGTITAGSSLGVESRPSRKNSAICIIPVTPSKKCTIAFLLPMREFPRIIPAR